MCLLAEKKASDAQALQISIDRARAQLDNQRNLHAELQRRAEKLEQEKASGLRRLEELRATNSGLKSQLAEAIKRRKFLRKTCCSELYVNSKQLEASTTTFSSDGEGASGGDVAVPRG